MIAHSAPGGSAEALRQAALILSIST
jgi:hypothetical protein